MSEAFVRDSFDESDSVMHLKSNRIEMPALNTNIMYGQHSKLQLFLLNIVAVQYLGGFCNELLIVGINTSRQSKNSDV